MAGTWSRCISSTKLLLEKSACKPALEYFTPIFDSDKILYHGQLYMIPCPWPMLSASITSREHIVAQHGIPLGKKYLWCTWVYTWLHYPKMLFRRICKGTIDFFPFRAY